MKNLIKEISREEMGLSGKTADSVTVSGNTHKPTPVIVCTDKRAVVFGHTENRSGYGDGYGYGYGETA